MSHIAFAFVPRKVAVKHKTPASSTLQKGSTSHPRPLLPPTSAASTSKSTCPDRPSAPARALPFKIPIMCGPRASYDIERCTCVRSNDNFFPLRYILEPPSPLSTAEDSEAAIARALRAHAADTVDLSIAIPSAERKTKLYQRSARRSMHPVDSSVDSSRGLLPTYPTEVSSSKVTLDAEPPKLESFAIVTVKTVKDAESFPGDQDKTDAARFGFRACSKARWDELNAEYVEYRAGLARTEDVGRNRDDDDSRDEQPLSSSRSDIPHTSSPAYRPNCLVYSQSRPRDKQKLSLRAFFADALGIGADHAGEANDYVDYTVGVDSVGLFLTGTHSSRVIRPVAVSPSD
ncbi:hypothetical protein C8F01DRAFT_1360583 [Mycena amicta]|nr:hypothetical protein C8F01DRAFT_1360583 [Mycena amicta]